MAKSISPKSESLFWSKVNKQPNGCWLWTAQKTRGGYGMVRINARRKMATHVALLLVNGVTVPKGMHACHTCDNPSCVNPAHLFVGTARDNAADKMSKCRGRGARKLSKDDIVAIRHELANGVSERVLASRYGISQPTVHFIKNRKTYREIGLSADKKG